MSRVEIWEKIFLSSEVKMKFSIEQKVFIISSIMPQSRIKKSRNNDDAWFHLTGFINSHNYRVWSVDNPHNIASQLCIQKKKGMWGGMFRKELWD